ncbi:Uncharacterized protein SCF082_LOCUS36566 [Durusdinium trenchii]|uniref:Uncharacterized protein n=1 Tax=Durusdinium trenchii TaxID=1381693 RepID=A0ABP0PHI6_9DINO
MSWWQHVAMLSAVWDSDMDIQVRRCPGSNHADALFTETDKLKVKQNLQKCTTVTGDVKIGSIALKFVMQNKVSIDLVLVNPRPEEFPRLRGGDNFYVNSERINTFLEETHAARLAIVSVKNFFGSRRPKGLLLEAIVWRLSKTYPLWLTEDSAWPAWPTRQKAGEKIDLFKELKFGQLSVECFLFFSLCCVSAG